MGTDYILGPLPAEGTVVGIGCLVDTIGPDDDDVAAVEITRSLGFEDKGFLDAEDYAGTVKPGEFP